MGGPASRALLPWHGPRPSLPSCVSYFVSLPKSPFLGPGPWATKIRLAQCWGKSLWLGLSLDLTTPPTLAPDRCLAGNTLSCPLSLSKLLSRPGRVFKEPSLGCSSPAAARGSTPDHGRLGLPCLLTLTSSCDLDFICDSDFHLIACTHPDLDLAPLIDILTLDLMSLVLTFSSPLMSCLHLAHPGLPLMGGKSIHVGPDLGLLSWIGWGLLR